MDNDRKQRRRMLDAEIDPVTCILFVLILFLIVPFTVLSPFRYPQPSALDRMLAVHVGGAPLARDPVAQAFANLPERDQQ